MKTPNLDNQIERMENDKKKGINSTFLNERLNEYKSIKEQLTLTDVVASLPSKEEMYLKELQEFKEALKEDAAVSRIDFGAGFVKCYNWLAKFYLG